MNKIQSNKLITKLFYAGLIFMSINFSRCCTRKTSILIRQCPDEWIINKMPSVDKSKAPLSSEYFIINGVRRELKDFDMKWIRNNCATKEASPVY